MPSSKRALIFFNVKPGTLKQDSSANIQCNSHFLTKELQYILVKVRIGVNKYVIFDCGFKLLFKVYRLEHMRVRAKMNLACKQVVKTCVGLYTKVIYIACNCVKSL